LGSSVLAGSAGLGWAAVGRQYWVSAGQAGSVDCGQALTGSSVLASSAGLGWAAVGRQVV
jgi:hypothetical protein